MENLSGILQVKSRKPLEMVRSDSAVTTVAGETFRLLDLFLVAVLFSSRHHFRCFSENINAIQTELSRVQKCEDSGKWLPVPEIRA